MFRLLSKKLIAFLRSTILLNWTYGSLIRGFNRQTVETQIRQFIMEQSDQWLQYLPLWQKIMSPKATVNSYLASGDFCRLLITFANSLDPDQDQQNVCLDLDPNHLTHLQCSWNNFLEKFILKKSQQMTTETWKITQYSKTCVKRPLSKRQKNCFQDQLLLNAGKKYCRMLQGKHFAILWTFIKLPFVTKIFVLSIFEQPFYTWHIFYCMQS